jgi:hypothetical protein
MNINRADYLELLKRQAKDSDRMPQNRTKRAILATEGGNLSKYPTKVKKASKYHNIRTVVDGISFMSKKEAQRYCELKIALAGGVIVDLELQPVFELQESFIDKDNKKIRSIIYRADFRFIETETNLTIIEDTKGYFTEIFKIKEKLFKKKYPKLILRIL